MTTDATNELLLGSYGEQEMVHGLSWVFFSPRVGDAEPADIQSKQLRYLVVDHRLSSALPIRLVGSESGAVPMKPAPPVSRICLPRIMEARRRVRWKAGWL